MRTSKISETAEQAGVSADTLRYYERLGLLTPTERSASGYRLYDANVAARIRFIKGAQRVGLRLGEIKELLDIRDRGACPCGHTRDLLEQRLRDIDEESRRLAALRRDLTGCWLAWTPATSRRPAHGGANASSPRKVKRDELRAMPELWLSMWRASMLVLRPIAEQSCDRLPVAVARRKERRGVGAAKATRDGVPDQASKHAQGGTRPHRRPGRQPRGTQERRTWRCHGLWRTVQSA